jgi:hypothetical protein
MNVPRATRNLIVPAWLSATLAGSAIAGPATVPTRATGVKAGTAIPTVVPLRIRTDGLAATGLGRIEVPVPMKIATQPLSAVGLGTAEPPPRPLQIRTDALTARGQDPKPGGPN